MKFEKYGDIAAGGAVAAFAVLGLAYLIPVGVKSPPNVSVAPLAPAFWPSIILWMMLGFAALIIAKGIFGIMRADTDSAEADMDSGMKSRTTRTLAAIVLLFVYQAAIEPIGMVLASIIAGLAFTALAGERRYRFFVPVAVLLPIVLYYFFTKIAAIPIPLGFFEFVEF
tara:strand:+ start:1152 stop:1658 length:507 start_codon:yes stop_codon:yes gene_type:complete